MREVWSDDTVHRKTDGGNHGHAFVRAAKEMLDEVRGGSFAIGARDADANQFAPGETVNKRGDEAPQKMPGAAKGVIKADPVAEPIEHGPIIRQRRRVPIFNSVHGLKL